MSKREDLIQRGALLDAYDAAHKGPPGGARKLIATAPAVDAVMVVHGQWIGVEYDSYADGYPVYDLWECSVCGEEHKGERDTLTNYCPHCGAMMDGDESDDPAQENAMGMMP